MKIRTTKTENKITTTIKRSELLSKLRCLGGSNWCSEEKFSVEWALDGINTAIADLLSYQNLYSFSPEPNYELKLTKRQIDLMFLFYRYINKGRFNDAYHELWNSIERLWVSYNTDDFLAYDELIAIYGLLFTFKLVIEISTLKNSYQDIQNKLEKTTEKLEQIECEYNRIQFELERTEHECEYCLTKAFNTEITCGVETYEEKIINNLLTGELKINELCFAERTGNKSFYISALRFARDSKNKEEYKQVLELLQSDISHIPKGALKEKLMSVYDAYKEVLNILDGNVKTVQIDVEKEFNQMVEDYNQISKNTSINPFDIK